MVLICFFLFLLTTQCQLTISFHANQSVNFFLSFRPFCCFRRLKVLKYACLACTSRNLEQILRLPISGGYTFPIWTRLSTSDLTLKPCLERPSVLLYTMKFWYAAFLLNSDPTCFQAPVLVSQVYINNGLFGFCRLVILITVRSVGFQAAIYGHAPLLRVKTIFYTVILKFRKRQRLTN